MVWAQARQLDDQREENTNNTMYIVFIPIYKTMFDLPRYAWLISNSFTSAFDFYPLHSLSSYAHSTILIYEQSLYGLVPVYAF